jgi:DNA-binding NarL/FixJ family response regulator
MEKSENKLVFIVEDNNLYSIMLDYYLTNETNVKCVVFRTGEECIENLNMNPMLIVLDYWLPGINGKETLKEIKKINPKIPVVMLTSNQDENVEKDLLDNNVQEYLHKEENSVSQIVKIVNSFIDRVNEKERKNMIILKVALFILFFAGVLIALIYIN